MRMLRFASHYPILSLKNHKGDTIIRLTHAVKLLAVGVTTSSLLLVGPTVTATPYGSSLYGECVYQDGCPEPAPAPSSPSTSNPSGESSGQNPQTYSPPPAPNNPHFEIVPANIKDGSVIRDKKVTISVSVHTLGDATTEPNTSDFGWVSVYVDNKLVGTDYTPNNDGIYYVTWDVLRYPGSLVSIVGYNQDGAAVARKDLSVVLDLPPNVQTATPAPLEGEPTIIAKALRSIPPVVVYYFPYWLFLLLFFLSLSYLYQTVREAVATERMRKLLKRQQLIAEQKDNFIMLASHYLHTPLTVMRNGADTVIAVKEAPETVTAPLVNSLEALKGRIDTILGRVESNEVLSNIKQPDQIKLSSSILTNPTYWVPVAAVALIIVVMNTLLSLVGKWDFSIQNFTTQFIVGAIVIAFFFVIIRSYHLRRTEKRKLAQLMEYEEAIDAARTSFIDESTAALREGLAQVEAAKAPLPQSPTANFVSEGYNRFAEILSRFDLLRQIRAGADYGAAEAIDLQQTFDQIIAQYQPTIETKKLVVQADAASIQAVGSPALLAYVIRTVVDNAIKFSPEGGQITLTANKQSGKVSVSIKDNGIGIPEEKLPTLFQPFSRADSALQFDYEGLGFSLFLDRIIMDYLGGEIDVVPQDRTAGTMVQVTV